jgi:hypothetical protein
MKLEVIFFLIAESESEKIKGEDEDEDEQGLFDSSSRLKVARATMRAGGLITYVQNSAGPK